MPLARLLPIAAVLVLGFLLPSVAQAQAPDCPCTVFPASAAPGGDAANDAPVEVGMKFRSAEAGYISALRFYKQANNTGTHTGHLWTSTGTLLAEVEFTDETASGWQEVALADAVPITAATTYVVSYHSSQGRYARTSQGFASAVDGGVLTGLSDGSSGGNGVYRYTGTGAFPNESWQATNYWVDAKFERTPPPDTRAPRVSSVTPANGATDVPPTGPVTATFDEEMDPASVTTSSFTLTSGGGTAVPASVSYNASNQTATLTPTSAPPFGQTLTATVKGGTTGVKDVAGNPMAADKAWSFTGPRACPCTIFTGAQAPLGNAISDNPIEVGMKFRASEDGFITHLRFYKQANNTGTHTGHLWTADGTMLAEVEFTNETASGWQQEELPVPIAITKDTTYVTSYYSPNGRFGFSPGYFGSPAGQAPLTAPAQTNGVYKYGASSTFPTDTFNATNYWVDATFTRTMPPDTRPPRVGSTNPATDATGVAPNATVKATFDEPVDQLTVNSASIVLRDDLGNAVAGSVAYDAGTRTATLTPTAALAYGKTYTATVKSGSGGVKDMAGNGLVADRSWTFSTPAQCPCTIFASTAPSSGSAVKDQPLEVGVKFRSSEDGFVTKLRFYKHANNVGTHRGNLWAADGTLLASAPFTNETASGWQSVELPNAVAITKDTTYVVSYHSSAGYFAFEPGGLNNGVDRAPMRALPNSQGGNGVYRYGASAFPDQTYNATNYWVDATFERAIPPDTRGPTVIETNPDNAAFDVPRTAAVRAIFDEPLDPASVTTGAFTLRNPQGATVPATASYDAQTKSAILTPTGSLAYSTEYTATLKGGEDGVTDVAGNPIAAEKTWTFTSVSQPLAEGPGGPIALITDPANKFSEYYAEILRSEGLNSFTTVEAPVTADKLTGRTTVILAAPVSTGEVTLLTNWVSAGGNLIAMRPDKKLAPLLGLTDAGTTLGEAYMKVNGASAAGAGIESMSLQYHGTADRYTLNGASSVATLYSNASTATSNPAVSLRGVGTSGGQAAAFAYDLARSVVLTRQGNPAWAGQKRDGLPIAIRSNDLFYGNKAGDPQPDWVAPDRFDVPQADEQQRLLANLITQMNLDKAPLPRFWYLPRGEKAALVLTGDDHAKGGTPAYLDRLKTFDPAGCSVAEWECVRATSYMYSDTAVSDAQVAAYQADGFEMALHFGTGCQNYTPTSVDVDLGNQLAAFESTWPSARPPSTNRTHCTVWSDWASQPKAERKHGVRFDTNYYYIGPPAWMQSRGAGLMTGSGFPQRFGDLDGSMIDVYQAMTQVTDEAEEWLPTTSQMHSLLDGALDNALGSQGYYGVFTAILHSDLGDHTELNDMVSEAQDRGVPIVSSAQMLDWLDGRNGSSFSGIAFDGSNLTFSVVTNDKARGIEAMLPLQSAGGPISRLTRGGQPVSWKRRTVKGIEYAVFKAPAGAYQATYAADNRAPDITATTATPDGQGRATVTWSTDEPSTSLVSYGRTSTLGSEAGETAPVTEHSIELTDLSPGTTYSFRVSSTDAAGNAGQSPITTFTTPPGGLVDTRTSDFAAGTRSGSYSGATLDGTDGEVQLQPAIGEEFESGGLPAGWTVQPWNLGGSVTPAYGSLFADSAVAYPGTFSESPRTLEFTATFRPVSLQGVGFSNDFSDFPLAAFTSGNLGDPFGVYASSGASPATARDTFLPGVTLNQPHRFRIVWRPNVVEFYVDGAAVATHPVTIEQEMRPIVSDYGLFGASVRAHWLRQGSYTTLGTFTSRTLDSGPGAAVWGALSSERKLPAGSGITFQTRSGATKIPDASWSAWQPIGAGGAIASPAARYIQYRAQLTGDGVSTPTLERVSITYSAGTNAPPQGGSVDVTPAAPRTNQAVTAAVSGFSDADGDPLTYHYRWLRNGTPIAGATTSTLDLALPGNGDRGDSVRVEVYATDGRGAASDAVVKTFIVADTNPTSGSVAIVPAGPATNDLVRAASSGFADIDGDQLTYGYQWFRNGAAIAGATNRTLDLAVAGNGNQGDLIEVEVRANDGHGGTSPVVRVGQSITGTNSAPVPGTVGVAPSPARTDQTLTATPSGFVERDGQAITYSYRWLRNGTPIAGATAATLDLAQAGNGDRGDTLRVEVTARDPLGAESEAVTADAPVVNSAPVEGTVAVKPATLATNDTASASVSGFSDADSDALTYQYQWYRNGTAIAGETARTLDLAEQGNGSVGDLIEVEVTALDGNGGSSPLERGGRTITSTTSSPVASFGFEEAAGSVAVNETGATDGQLTGAARDNSGRFGRALSFDGDDDIVTVADDPALALTTGMTIEAWVRPDRATNWRTVMMKESTGGMAYVLYGSTDQADEPSARVGLEGDTGVEGPEELDPNKWSHLAATYDGNLLRFYVDGIQVGSRAYADQPELPTGAGPLTIGGNQVWGERFSGLIDEVRVYNRRLTAEEIGEDMDRPVVEGTPRPPANDSPDAIGAFGAPQEWPITPVHLALTNDGRIAAWDGFDAAVNSEHIWDPWTGEFEGVPTGRNLFCAGHIQLQDGRLLVAGGHVQAYEGTKDTNLFNPQSETWQRGADMTAARWYPTVTGLPDGRVFVISGDAVSFANQFNQNVEVPLRIASQTTPEIYNPATDTWTSLPSAARTMALYPFMFVLPDGRLFDAGPERMTRTLNLSTGQWSNVGNSPIDGQSAVMYRPGKVMKAGTWSEPEFPGREVSNRSATIDMTAASPTWQESGGMRYRRSYSTLTMLPDGKVLATGGQAATDGVDETTGLLPAEMWDPDTGVWKTMASSRRPRLYHSSAILLPDARVLLAGGGAYGNAKNEKSAEIYSPPYLFKGPRPTVTAAPDEVHYGQSFTVDTPDASRIAKVSLVRMGSVTHNLDMDQRYLELNRTVEGDGVRIDGPANANVAPPGMYMVFLVDDQGVPSTGQIVKVDSAADTQAPTAPTGLAATPQTDGAGLNWAAASDNVGVDEYRVYRSTTAGFTPSAANRVARVPSGTSWTDSGLAAGTYHYRVRAVDEAGNLGQASNQATAVVAGDTTAPTISVTAPAAGASLAEAVNVTADAADAVGVKSVQFKLDGQDLGAADTSAPYSVSWDTRTAGDGTHSLTAVARDASGNATTSAAVAVEVHNTGLVAAYGFDEPSGATAADAVDGHHGTITGAGRVVDGRFGGALSFDGVDDWVSVPHDPALSLSAGMTIEAWVKPSALASWRGVVMKEQASALPYALYANTAAATPGASVFTTAAQDITAPPTLGLGNWTHLAMTWNGTQLRLYVDGAEIANRAAPGALLTSTGQLRIGGNSLRGEFFAGLIDEVRVYDRALSAQRIGADMNTPVTP